MTIEEGSFEEMDAPNTAALIAGGVLTGAAVAFVMVWYGERRDRKRALRTAKSANCK